MSRQELVAGWRRFTAWFGRYRVLAISGVNSIAIILIAWLLAVLVGVGRAPPADAEGRRSAPSEARSSGTPAPPPPRAAARTPVRPVRRPPAPASRLGRRDYDVQLRAPPRAESPLEPARDPLEERMEELAPDDLWEEE